jgi:hypothetical protein
MTTKRKDIAETAVEQTLEMTPFAQGVEEKELEQRVR